VHHVAHEQNHIIIQAIPVLLQEVRKLSNAHNAFLYNNNLQQKFGNVHYFYRFRFDSVVSL